MYLKSVHLDSSYFADHACLWARFEDFSQPPKIRMWKKPSKIPWDQLNKVNQEDDKTLSKTTLMAAHTVAGLVCESAATPALRECTSGLNENINYHDYDMSNEYEDIAKTLEAEVELKLKENNLPPLQSHQKGRGVAREVRWVQEFSSPPKLCRESDLQPEYHGLDIRHAQWVRQARRCHNYAQLVKQHIPEITPKHEHKDKLWQSIVSTSGFSMPFRKWWNQQSCKEMPHFPQCPPPYPEACVLARVMTRHLRQFEQSLRQPRIHNAKTRRQNDANLIFKDIQDKSPEPVQMLVSETNQ